MENITQNSKNINKEKRNSYAQNWMRVKRNNAAPIIPWRSLKEDGLPKLFVGEVHEDQDEVSWVESPLCLVYFNKANEYGLKYAIAKYIKTVYTNGMVSAHWFEWETFTTIENVTHWTILPQPPKAED